jgi:hypothetical protein
MYRLQPKVSIGHQRKLLSEKAYPGVLNTWIDLFLPQATGSFRQNHARFLFLGCISQADWRDGTA